MAGPRDHGRGVAQVDAKGRVHLVERRDPVRVAEDHEHVRLAVGDDPARSRQPALHCVIALLLLLGRNFSLNVRASLRQQFRVVEALVPPVLPRIAVPLRQR